MNRHVAGALVGLLAVTVVGILLVGGLGDGGSTGVHSDGAQSAGVTTVPGDATGATTARPPRGGDANRSTAATTETSAETTATPDYDFTIDRVEECGTNCRVVTARLVNDGATTRRNVRVSTTVLADGEALWSGNETVGTLASSESHVSTERVEVGFSGGLQISANDGYVTVVTVVRSESGTTRFSERRKVA